MIRSKDLPVEMREKLGIKQRKPRRPRQMNLWELHYSTLLELRRQAGEIVHWGFEEIFQAASASRPTS